MVISTARVKKIEVPFSDETVTIAQEKIVALEISFAITGEPLLSVVYLQDENIPQAVTCGLGSVKIFLK